VHLDSGRRAFVLGIRVTLVAGCDTRIDAILHRRLSLEAHYSTKVPLSVRCDQALFLHGKSRAQQAGRAFAFRDIGHDKVPSSPQALISSAISKTLPTDHIQIMNSRLQFPRKCGGIYLAEYRAAQFIAMIAKAFFMM
jgi:hypothetical protein